MPVQKARIDYLFGETGRWAGFFLLIAGSAMLVFSAIAIVIIITGVFTAFSCTLTSMDITKRRIRFSTHFFGFIPSGKWLKITPEMKMIIEKPKIIYRTYSRGNRALETEKSEYRLWLTDHQNRKIGTIRKFYSFERAKQSKDRLIKELFKDNEASF